MKCSGQLIDTSYDFLLKQLSFAKELMTGSISLDRDGASGTESASVMRVKQWDGSFFCGSITQVVLSKNSAQARRAAEFRKVTRFALARGGERASFVRSSVLSLVFILISLREFRRLQPRMKPAVSVLKIGAMPRRSFEISTVICFIRERALERPRAWMAGHVWRFLSGYHRLKHDGEPDSELGELERYREVREVLHPSP